MASHERDETHYYGDGHDHGEQRERECLHLHTSVNASTWTCNDCGLSGYPAGSVNSPQQQAELQRAQLGAQDATEFLITANAPLELVNASVGPQTFTFHLGDGRYVSVDFDADTIESNIPEDQRAHLMVDVMTEVLKNCGISPAAAARPAGAERTGRAAATYRLYERMIGPIREAARTVGYAVGVHGSLDRDIDLIAVAWTGDAADAPTVAEAIRKAAETVTGFAAMKDHEGADNPDFFADGMPGAKPWGRRAWSFYLNTGTYIDLSVLPPRGEKHDDPMATARAERAEAALAAEQERIAGWLRESFRNHIEYRACQCDAYCEAVRPYAVERHLDANTYDCPKCAFERWAARLVEEATALRTAAPAAPAATVPVSKGAELIAAERRRQIEVEGYDPEYDTGYIGGELAKAAAAYMEAALYPAAQYAGVHPNSWPWGLKYWKPKDARSNLIRAGALIAAELDRLGASSDAHAASTTETGDGDAH